jgi:alpha-aminoadipate carrier protein LysW
MQTAKCPDCNSDIIVEDEAYEGDLVECANCGRELEIVSVNPLQLLEIKSDEQKELGESSGSSRQE